MICSVCGGSVVKVSGKGNGYYGCLRAARRAGENRLLVRRSLAERITLAAVRDRLSSREHLAYVPQRVRQEIGPKLVHSTGGAESKAGGV